MKINKKLQLLIFILVILSAGYFAFNEFYLSKKAEELKLPESTIEQMFVFENKNPNVSEEEFKNYAYKVEQAKKIIQDTPYALNPTHWLKIARMKKYVNDFVGAEQIYLYLLSKDTNNYLLAGNLADLYANYFNDYKNAVKAYWEAVGRSKHNAQINLLYYKNLADLYADKLPDTRKDFEEKSEQALTSNLFKESVDFRTMLADYYQRISNNEKRMFYLEEALKLDPNNQIIQQELSELKNN